MILINSSPKDAVRILQPFFVRTVPISIGFLLAYCERENVKTFCIDQQFEEDVVEAAGQYIEKMKTPYIFGFSVLTTALKAALETASELKKKYPNCVTLFGGIHPTAMPTEVLQYPQVDFVIRGEGEQPLVDFYHRIKNGESVEDLGNLSYRKDGEIIHNPLAYFVDDLNDSPSFPYHLFDPDRYDLGIIMSSRGCPYNCIFCSNRIVTGKRYRYRTSKTIADELELLHNKYNRTSISFWDDNFLVSKKRLYELIEEIKQRGLLGKMTFSFQGRGDNVDPDLMKALYDAGFNSVFFGLETASEEIMETIKKGETVADNVNAVNIVRDIGYFVNATFVYGLPGDTHKDRMDCIKMTEEIQLDAVRYNNATPYPGTELYTIAKDQGRFSVIGTYDNFISVSGFIDNPFKPIPFSYLPPGNSEAEIRRDILFSYFRFYFNIPRLWRAISRRDLGLQITSDKKFNLLETAQKIIAGVFLIFIMAVKLIQLFQYEVIRKDTRISFGHFMKIFGGRL